MDSRHRDCNKLVASNRNLRLRQSLVDLTRDRYVVRREVDPIAVSVFKENSLLGQVDLKLRGI